jgi:hypothetical protein
LWWNEEGFNERCSFFFLEDFYLEQKNWKRPNRNELKLVEMHIFALEN